MSEDNDHTTEEIESMLNELQQELLRLVGAKAQYQTVADEIYRLRELKQIVLAENAEREGKR